MKNIFFFLLLFVHLKLKSQATVRGEYYFNRQEMVAGFNFSAEGKFDFFYSYGAIDRSASGTFSVEGDILKLKSNKEAGKDFTIKAQSKKPKGYSIVFEDANQYLIKDILCVCLIDGTQKEAYADSKGEVHLDLPKCDSIYAQHPLFPDIFTLIKDINNENNSFILTLNPSLANVSFKGIDFKIVDDKVITCIPNYFMPLDGIKFVKK